MITPEDQVTINNTIDSAVRQAIQELTDKFDLRLKEKDNEPVKPHSHNRYDSPQVEGGDLLGFPIDSAAPSFADEEGKFRLYSSGGVYKLYVRLNKGWRSVTLT